MPGNSKRTQIKLVHEGLDENGKMTTHFYTTTISKANAAGTKLVRKKYNPILRKHVEYVQAKMK